MAKRSIISATAVQKRLKQLDDLKKEVQELREKVAELEGVNKEVVELRSTLALLADRFLEKEQEPYGTDLGDDTWDPSRGAMPEGMKQKGKFKISVKRRDDVKTIEKGNN